MQSGQIDDRKVSVVQRISLTEAASAKLQENGNIFNHNCLVPPYCLRVFPISILLVVFDSGTFFWTVYPALWTGAITDL